MPDDRVVQAFDRLWRRLISFPNAEVCKHYAATLVLEEMEALGIAPPPNIIGAVVNAEDQKALNWRRRKKSR
jgi:hypothetical protein